MSHSAGGPLGGYFWQVRRGLLALMRAQIGYVIEIETRDDVVIFQADGLVVASVQTKHSYDHGSLTMSSRDLWKTLRAWLDVGEPRSGDGAARLVLVTTDQVSETTLQPFRLDPDGSAEPLQAAVATLVTQLDGIGARRPNAELGAAYDAWSNAPVADRHELVTKLRILDGQERLDQVDATILAEVAKFVPPVHQSAFSERLLGWFETQIAERLTVRGCRISRQELTEHIYTLVQSFPSAVALDSYALATHPDPDAEVAVEPPYIRQLILLNAAAEQLSFAVGLHHRAQLERNRVMQTTLQGQQQLNIFDAELRDFWGLKFRPGDEATQDDVAFGWSVHDSCMVYSVGLAGTSAPRFLVAGSFHQLADRLLVGWHPRFRNALSSRAGG